MAPPRYFRSVPENEARWLQTADQAGVRNKSINSHMDLRSGSDITQEQFLLFRTICPKIKTPDMLAGTNFISPVDLALAQNALLASQDFQRYVAAVGTNQWSGIGGFERVLEQQFEVIRGTAHLSNALVGNDEDIVNSSFLLLLQTILSLHPNPQRQWRVSKIRLAADFATTRRGTTRSGIDSSR